MIKPVISSILMASVLFAGAGQALASDRQQSYRDRGTEYHQRDRDVRKHQAHRNFERHEFKHHERYPRYAYRYRDGRPAWRRHHVRPRLEHSWRYRHHPRPVVVVHDRGLMGPVIAGAILGAVIANNHER